MTQIIRFPSVAEYVRLQLAATPLSVLLEGMKPARQRNLLTALTRDLMTSLDIGSDTTELTYPQQAYVALASK